MSILLLLLLYHLKVATDGRATGAVCATRSSKTFHAILFPLWTINDVKIKPVLVICIRLHMLENWGGKGEAGRQNDPRSDDELGSKELNTYRYERDNFPRDIISLLAFTFRMRDRSCTDL